MNHKMNRFLASLFLALALGVILITPLALWQGRAAAASPVGVPIQVQTLNSASIATSTTWTGGRWAALGTDQPPTAAEIWLFVDETTVNTTSFGLQISPDNSTWLPHTTAGSFASNVAADGNTFYTLSIQGVYWRIVSTATNTNTLTPTIKVVLK